MGLVIIENHSTQGAINKSANYMKVRVNGKEIELPQSCASNSDYKKSMKSNIPLKTKIFQYHVNLNGKGGNITTRHRQETLLKNYQNIQTHHNPMINDINFWWDGHEWTNEEREAALNLQERMNTDFLSDVVANRNAVNTFDFNTRLDDLLHRPSKKIKSPSVSLRSPPKAFRTQLDLIYKKRFQRFNADWSGLGTFAQNWNILSAFLNNKKIWCNMTGIRRRDGESRSYMMLGIAHGAHTVGLGYPPISNKKRNFQQTSYMFNSRTFRYDIMPNTDPAICDTNSHNLLHDTIISSHVHIKNNIFYNRFLPTDFLP